MLLTLPPIDEQRAIAHILGTLDDKIELNRRMNETLEAMAQAIFKSWFVDWRVRTIEARWVTIHASTRYHVQESAARPAWARSARARDNSAQWGVPLRFTADLWRRLSDKLLVQPGDLYVSLKDVTQSADLLGAVARLPLDHRPGRLTQDTVKLRAKVPDVPSTIPTTTLVHKSFHFNRI